MAENDNRAQAENGEDKPMLVQKGLINFNRDGGTLAALIKALSEVASWVDSTLLARWNAKTRADVAVIEARGRAEVAVVEAGGEVLVHHMREHGRVVPELIHSPEALVMLSPREERMHSRLHAVEYQRQMNLENVLFKCAEELPEQKPLTPPDKDWFNRFWTAAQDVSDEQMQSAWGRVLAREVTHSGSFSLRTLNALSNMSRSEAELFQRIAPYVFDDVGLMQGLIQENIFSFAEILALSDIGLVDSNGLLFVDYTPTSQYRFFQISLVASQCVLFQAPEKCQTVSVPAYLLTGAGKELLRMINPQLPPEMDSLVEKIVLGLNRGIRRIPDKDVYIVDNTFHVRGVTDLPASS